MKKNHTVTVNLPTGYDENPDELDAPSSKAAHVADLVRAYRDIYDDGESLDTVLIDLVADLMHYADGLPADERDWGVDGALGEYVVERATSHYLEERDDA